MVISSGAMAVPSPEMGALYVAWSLVCTALTWATVPGTGVAISFFICWTLPSNWFHWAADRVDPLETWSEEVSVQMPETAA